MFFDKVLTVDIGTYNLFSMLIVYKYLIINNKKS